MLTLTILPAPARALQVRPAPELVFFVRVGHSHSPLLGWRKRPKILTHKPSRLRHRPYALSLRVNLTHKPSSRINQNAYA
jgi:hypothetical protein